MNPIDTNYLSLQFQNRVYKETGTSFQTMFEGIMSKAFPDFKIIRPYGRQGDGGNDGYQPSAGIYYQVYAPLKPDEKEAAAAAKLKADFIKLHSTWNQIAEVKVFFFVFNDKWHGTSIEIEKALAELAKEYEAIKFNSFLAKDLESVFSRLTPEQLLSLGFDIAQTKVVSLAKESLELIETYLDMENGETALRMLTQFKEALIATKDEGVLFSADILEARILEKLERVDEAKIKFKALIDRHPSNPLAALHLASIYLYEEDFEANLALIKQAETIEPNHYQLTIQRLLRTIYLNEKIDLAHIDEKSFPDDFRAKANLYRLYAILFINIGDTTSALRYIANAISLNPDRVANHVAKLSILEAIAFSGKKNREQLKAAARQLLSEFDAIYSAIASLNGLTPRNIVILESKRISALFAIEDFDNAIKSVPLFLKQVPNCHFNHTIDRLLAELLIHIQIPDEGFDAILRHTATKPISEDLAKAILLQFIRKGTIFTDGRKFFSSVKSTHVSTVAEFIDNIERKDYTAAWEYLGKDTRFAVIMATGAKSFLDLRRIIIENLPNDGNVQKEKLLLLLNYDQENIEEAFDLLKKMDLAELGYLECKPILEIVQRKEAWDFAVKISEKLLKTERDPENILKLKLLIFGANLKLKRLQVATALGEALLSEPTKQPPLTRQTCEDILGQVILARIQRGEYKEAKSLLLRHSAYSNSFEFKVGIETELHIKNRDGHSALSSLVDGIKILNTPSPEQYGRLFYIFTNISNLIGFKPTECEIAQPGCFIKLKTIDRWYFIGEGNPLEATKVSAEDTDYNLFLKKKLGDMIPLQSKYQSTQLECEIEHIFAIESYILWQCHHHAEKLTKERRWSAMEMIDIPTKGDTIDPQYLIARMADEQKPKEALFDMYCENGHVPFAFLALNDGGIGNALGHIVNAKRGYVNFSSGATDELNQQIKCAQDIISGKECFLDGTSALILAESEMGEIVRQHIPNLKVPQSVIAMLFGIKDKFQFNPGQFGNMGYVDGKLLLSQIDHERRELVRNKFERFIDLLESTPANIPAISAATKHSCFTEQDIPPEFSDPCALARNNNGVVITEDFSYLKANEIETKRPAPGYCSVYALIKLLQKQGKISFDQYLYFFSYLTSYRFRFLPVSVDEIEKAIYGDKGEIQFHPEKLKRFNFPLTLSEAYGVKSETAFRLIVAFFFRATTNDSVSSDMLGKLFNEVISEFPAQASKKDLARTLAYVIERIATPLLQQNTATDQTKEKLSNLSRFAEGYTDDEFLL